MKNCVLLLGVLLIAFSCSPGSNHSTRALTSTRDVAAGANLYKKYCFYCHGPEGRGDGAIGLGLPVRPADFVGDVERMKKSDDDLFQSISKGMHGTTGGESLQMPQWDLILKEDEIWDVLAYIRLLADKGRAGQKQEPRS